MARPKTATMRLRQLEKNDLTPQRGPVLVTGATGGVGSLALSLLSRRGYTVAASTGKPEAYDYLRRLGASEILSREEASAESNRPLEPERWARSIDTVGGPTLAYLMRTTKKGGAIASEVTLEDIPRVTRAMLNGQTRGRILIKPSEQ